MSLDRTRVIQTIYVWNSVIAIDLIGTTALVASSMVVRAGAFEELRQ